MQSIVPCQRWMATGHRTPLFTTVYSASKTIRDAHRLYPYRFQTRHTYPCISTNLWTLCAVSTSKHTHKSFKRRSRTRSWKSHSRDVTRHTSSELAVTTVDSWTMTATIRRTSSICQAVDVNASSVPATGDLRIYTSSM